MCILFSDQYLFPLLQYALVAITAVSIFKDFQGTRGGLGMKVTRLESSINRLYAAYGVFTGVVVGITLSVDVAKDYRTILVIGDVLMIAYICLKNRWFRNRIFQFSNALLSENNH